MTGDEHIPAGQQTWYAAAKTLREPWDAKEHALVEYRHLLSQHDDHLLAAHAADPAAMQLPEGDPEKTASPHTFCLHCCFLLCCTDTCCK